MKLAQRLVDAVGRRPIAIGASLLQAVQPYVVDRAQKVGKEVTAYALGVGWTWITHQTTVSLTFDQNDYFYSQISNWLTTKSKHTPTHIDGIGLVSIDGLDEDTSRNSTPAKTRKSHSEMVAGNPSAGLYLIWHEGTPIVLQFNTSFERNAYHIVLSIRRTLKLWSYRGQLPGMISFLQMVNDRIVQNEVRSVTVSVSTSQGYWERLHTVARRPIESVVLPSGHKEALITDLEKFFEDEEWYYNNAVPFRRGYLLYGVPGSGKSSLLLALASKFDMPLYILNLADPDLDDSKLQELFATVGNNVIVLLEDVDTILKGRTRNSKDRKLSFSAVLNAIDGVTASQDRILFMTTNNIDVLDPALIRPGRIDYRMEFGTLTPEQASELILRFYSELESVVDDIVHHPKITQMVASELQKLLIDVRPNPYDLPNALEQYDVVKHA